MAQQSVSVSKQKEIRKILGERTKSRSMKIYLNFQSDTMDDFQNFTVFPEIIEITQDFVENYADYIYMRVEVTPDHFQQLVNNHKNLKAELIFRYLDEYTEEIGDEAVMKLKRKVLIRNYQNLNQNYTTEQLEDAFRNGDDLISIELELIEDELYHIRKKEIQFLARDVTMKDVILFVCKQLGFKKVHLVEPDNKRVYENFIMPPMQSMATVFDFLQYTEGMGIYQRGCNYYYSNGIMYIYPQYDTEPENGFTTHIYNAGTYEFKGQQNYHRYDDKGNLHILTSEHTEIQNIVQAGVENRRTGSVLFRTEHVVDHWHSLPTVMAKLKKTAKKYAKKAAMQYLKAQVPAVDMALKAYDKLKQVKGVGSIANKAEGEIKEKAEEDKMPKPVVDSDNFDSINRDLSIGMADMEQVKSGSVEPNYNNPFAVASEVASSYRNRMTVIWMHAEPMAIKPSFPVKFHYDEPSDEEKQLNREISDKELPGTCEKAVYTIHRLGQQSEMLFGCHGHLQLIVDPEKS